MTTTRRIFLALVCTLTLLAIPAFAADPVIRSGVDVFETGDATAAYFALDPIPADFFCPGSRAFSGKVPMKGVPLATSPPEAFGKADTIFERLDDAVFDDNGVAHTRIQFKALALVSVRPIKNKCGSFNLSVTLDGEQPISSDMTIVRERDDGGFFVTSFDTEFRLTFTPVEGWMKKRLELVRSETMRGVHSWASKPGDGSLPYKGSVLVDTDGDGEPETALPGRSNFAPGWGLSFDGQPIRLKAQSWEPGAEHEVGG
ncbi:MAG: hypothetical protein GY856_24275 [bacterium]|nr:hypothetical protein [bacterium]